MQAAFAAPQGGDRRAEGVTMKTVVTESHAAAQLNNPIDRSIHHRGSRKNSHEDAADGGMRAVSH